MKTYAILCAAVLALAGCSDENSKIRGEFIAGCVHGGLSKSVCACSFKKIESKCSGQLIPDTALSFSSATAGGSPPLN